MGKNIRLDHANYLEIRIGTTSAVGIFPKGESPYELLDASGNVWEWTANYEQNYNPDDQAGRQRCSGCCAWRVVQEL